MLIRTFLVWAILVCAAPAYAQKPVAPTPDLAPEDVISIQLKALSNAQNNSDTNSGIAQVWAFAHPSNRIVTGPFARFVMMLKSPNYRPLIGHRSHHMREISRSGDKAHYAVKVTGSNGKVLGYSWHLGKVGSGDEKGVWMTTGVTLVGELGRAL